MRVQWSIKSIATRRNWSPCQYCKGERYFWVPCVGQLFTPTYESGFYIDCYHCEDGYNVETKLGINYKLKRRAHASKA